MTRHRTAHFVPLLAAVLAVLSGARVVPRRTLAHERARRGRSFRSRSRRSCLRATALRSARSVARCGRTCPIRSLPKYVGQAFVAVEDQRFYEHDGVDVKGVLGAIKGKIFGKNRGGASTITQQLVGYMHPDIIDRREISGTAGISRKLHEQSAAREMERHYTKEKILEAYINQINLGRGWYGVDAGSRHYFGHPAAQLTFAEAATLAGLPKSQPTYDPIAHPERAKERRNLILQMMADQGYITQAQAYSDEG